MCFDKFVFCATTGWAWVIGTFAYWQHADGVSPAWRCATAVLAGLTAVAYLQACLTPAGAVPESWKASSSERPDQPLNGRRRWCAKCSLWKPARTHHCSICKACVLRYDHHCPWIANCVGFLNYKHFLLLVMYNTTLFWVCLATSWHTFRDSVFVPPFTPLRAELRDSPMMVRSFVAAYCTTAILGVMFAMFAGHHCKLAASNVTTVEELERGGPVYDLGCCSNLRAALGDWVCLWPFPFDMPRKTQEDGVCFEKHLASDWAAPPSPLAPRGELSIDVLAARAAQCNVPHNEMVRKASDATAYTLARSSSNISAAERMQDINTDLHLFQIAHSGYGTAGTAPQTPTSPARAAYRTPSIATAATNLKTTPMQYADADYIETMVRPSVRGRCAPTPMGSPLSTHSYALDLGA